MVSIIIVVVILLIICSGNNNSSNSSSNSKSNYNSRNQSNNYNNAAKSTENINKTSTTKKENNKFEGDTTVVYRGDPFTDNYKIKKVIVSDSIITIKKDAFNRCINLKEIEIPNSVTCIGEYAFHECINLKEIEIPNSVTSIGMNAFHECINLKEIEIPNSVTSIGMNAFHGCSNLEKIKISNSVTSIEGFTFQECSNLKEIKIPNSVISIDYCAFYRCNRLEKIEIPNSVTCISKSAFDDCNNIYIYCNKGSYAEKYARKYNIPFKYITDTKLQNQFKWASDLAEFNVKELKLEDAGFGYNGCKEFLGAAVNNPKTFKEFYSSKTKDQLKDDLDKVYYSKLRELKLKDASFGYNGCKEFLGAIELALFDKNVKSYIDKGIENVFIRDWGALDFSNYMDEIVEKYSEITMDEWNESYRYFEKNHSWLDKHPCASQEVVMKRFEFLQQRNSNSKENMVNDNETSNVVKIEKTDNVKKYKNEESENKIEFLSAQGRNIINEIINAAYEDFDRINRDAFNYSMRVGIFEKKLNRANGNKKLYAESLERNILYYFNLIEDIKKYIFNCIKTKRFPSSNSEWQSKFTQLENENKFTDINKARNKERLDVYKSFNDIDKLISELEWDYTYFHINSWLLGQSVIIVSEYNDFVRPLLKEFPNAVIKEFEKSCHIKTSIFLKSKGIKKISNENKQDLTLNKSKSFKEFYSSKTADQLKNDLDEVYYSKLRELNLKDASFSKIGSKEFLGAIELALFDKNVKSYIDKGIENVFTRNWGDAYFSVYMEEIVNKYSNITIKEWNESYNYFKENHSWLDQHPCVSQEVTMKRFEFIQQINIIPKDYFKYKEDKVFLEKIQWENSTTEVKELNHLDIMDNFPSILGNSLYYITYYICPDCKKSLLYKIKTRGVKTIFEGETKNLFNIFTCPICNRFYASIDSSENLVSTSTRLSDFALRSIAYSNNEYINLIDYTDEFENGY